MTTSAFIESGKRNKKPSLFSRTWAVSRDQLSNLFSFFTLHILNRNLVDKLGFFSACLFVFVLTIGCSSSEWLTCLPFSKRVGASSTKNEIVIPQPYRIEITGGQYQWKVRHPGFDGLLATSDDVFVGPAVHIPENTEIIFQLKSTDFVYLLSLPQLRLKEIAVPGLDFSITFRPNAIGEFVLEGDDMCGDSHPEMNGRLIIESRPQFERWLRQQTATNGNQLD